MNRPPSDLWDLDAARVQRPKKADLVADEIRRWIVHQNLNPGDRLPTEKQLIDRLKSSRGTIREALKIIESQGLITIRPGKDGGARVAVISYENMSFALKNYFYFQPLAWSDIYDFREKVEPHATELAVPFLTEQDFANLEATIEACHYGLASAGSWAEQRRQEGLFHNHIITRCPNPILRFTALFINDILLDFARFRDIISPQEDVFARTCVSDHENLLTMLRSGDAKGAAAATRAHIRELAQVLGHKEKFVEPSILMQRGPQQ